MATTEFSWDKPNNQNVLLEIKGDKLKLSDDVLISNIRWFITFRWALIVTPVFFEILMLSASDVLTQLVVLVNTLADDESVLVVLEAFSALM